MRQCFFLLSTQFSVRQIKVLQKFLGVPIYRLITVLVTYIWGAGFRNWDTMHTADSWLGRRGFCLGTGRRGNLVSVVKHAELSYNLISAKCDRHIGGIEQFDWYQVCSVNSNQTFTSQQIAL